MEFNHNNKYDFKAPVTRSDKFLSDLKEGQEAEDYIAAIQSGEIKHEVKYDRQALDTGNICIEFECRGKPSGVRVTEAQVWDYVVPGGLALKLPTNFIRWLVDKNKGRVVLAGDDWGNTKSSRCLLVPVEGIFRLYKEFNGRVG